MNAAFITFLAAKGLSGDDIAEAARLLENDPQSKRTARNARYYAGRKERLKPSENRLNSDGAIKTLSDAKPSESIQDVRPPTENNNKYTTMVLNSKAPTFQTDEPQRIQNNSVPNGTDASASIRPNLFGEIDWRRLRQKQSFDLGIQLLGAAGKNESQARSLIGKWCKGIGPEGLFPILETASRQGVLDPVQYVTAAVSAAQKRCGTVDDDDCFHSVSKARARPEERLL